MMSFNKDDLIVERTEDIKYIARLTNYNKKYVFTRNFIHGTRVILHKQDNVIEVGMVDKKAEIKYFIIDTKDKTIQEVSYVDIKNMIEADKAGFAIKYLGY